MYHKKLDIKVLNHKDGIQDLNNGQYNQCHQTSHGTQTRLLDFLSF